MLATAAQLDERLDRLGDFLARDRSHWELRPFCQLPVPWEPDHPEVARWLRGQPLEAIEALEGSLEPRFHEGPSDLRQWAREGRELAAVPELALATPAHPVAQRAFRVPQRKLQQIQAFSAALSHAWLPRVTEVVDWCAGMGHLGRAIAHALDLPVVCLERSEALCRKGRRLALHAGARCRFERVDVLDPLAWRQLGPERAAVALHACGDLGLTLLEQAVDRQVPALALAPCCYHRIGDDPRYRPLSRRARAADLRLDQVGLRLPMAEEIVAPPRERRARRRQMAWRLGLDLLRREASGEDRYRPLPPMPAAWVRLPFAAFCQRAAAAHDVTLPARFDAERVERAAWERLRLARGLALIRTIYRRPLELWLVLDRALFVAEQRYEVEVGSFCSRGLTPRNLLIRARRQR